jgi:integrase
VSIQPYKTTDGIQWRVRWREHDGRMRSRTALNKREAQAIDADVKARKYKGEALPKPARETLASAFDEWWRLRGSTLAPTTQRTYLAAWNAHVKDGFDQHRLSELVAEPQLFEELRARMRERNVGNAAQRKVLVVISAVLSAAVEWNRIPTNPVWRMRKPSTARQRYPRPFPPLVVERIRLRMIRRNTKDDGRRALADACLVSVMSYAGLRPGEALALRWDDISYRTILVDKAIADGAVVGTKTGVARTVPLVMQVSLDLVGLREARGGMGQDLVFPSASGSPWSRSEFNNWRNRVWKPILVDLSCDDSRLATLATARPYDCRGSFVSMHLRAGTSPLEVAQWAGHSPAVMFRHYANVIEELKGEPICPVETQISRARTVVAEMPANELDILSNEVMQPPAGNSPRRGPRLMYGPNMGP